MMFCAKKKQENVAASQIVIILKVKNLGSIEYTTQYYLRSFHLACKLVKRHTFLAGTTTSNIPSPAPTSKISTPIDENTNPKTIKCPKNQRKRPPPPPP